MNAVTQTEGHCFWDWIGEETNNETPQTVESEMVFLEFSHPWEPKYVTAFISTSHIPGLLGSEAGPTKTWNSRTRLIFADSWSPASQLSNRSWRVAVLLSLLGLWNSDTLRSTFRRGKLSRCYLTAWRQYRCTDNADPFKLTLETHPVGRFQASLWEWFWASSWYPKFTEVLLILLRPF